MYEIFTETNNWIHQLPFILEWPLILIIVGLAVFIATQVISALIGIAIFLVVIIIRVSVVIISVASNLWDVLASSITDWWFEVKARQQNTEQ